MKTPYRHRKWFIPLLQMKVVLLSVCQFPHCMCGPCLRSLPWSQMWRLISFCSFNIALVGEFHLPIAIQSRVLTNTDAELKINVFEHFWCKKIACQRFFIWLTVSPWHVSLNVSKHKELSHYSNLRKSMHFHFSNTFHNSFQVTIQSNNKSVYGF